MMLSADNLTDADEAQSTLRSTSWPTVLDVRVVTGTGGGADKTVLNAPRHLAQHGYRNLCAYMRHPKDRGFEHLVARASRLEAPVIPVDDWGPFDFRAIKSLLRICRDNNVAIWHAHEYKSNAIGLLLRRYWPMRLVTTVHGWVDDTMRLRAYNCVDRWCLKHYEHVWCVSHKLHEHCLSMGIQSSKCSRLDNGVDISQYSRKADILTAQKRLGIPSGRMVVGAIGRLSREKGFDTLIRTVHSLAQEGHKVHLVIAGEGPQENALRQLVAQLGAEEYVNILGFQANTVHVYEALNVYALSSVSEGMPNVVLEAMAMGVPIVATRVGAMPQLLTSGLSGLLVEPGSVEKMTLALRTMLTDAELQRRCAAAAFDKVCSDYSFEARMRKVAAFFDSLLSR